MADMPSTENFIFELLLAYGLPKASITRMREDGTYNHATVEGEKKVWFKPVDGDLFTTIGAMQVEEVLTERRGNGDSYGRDFELTGKAVAGPRSVL